MIIKYFYFIMWELKPPRKDMNSHQTQIGHHEGEEGEQHGPDDGGQVGKFVQVGGIAGLIRCFCRQPYQHPRGPHRLHQNHHAIEPCHDFVGRVIAPEIEQSDIDEREYQHPDCAIPVADPKNEHEKENSSQSHQNPLFIAYRQEKKADESHHGSERIAGQTHQSGFEFGIGLGGGDTAGILKNLDIRYFTLEQQRHQRVSQFMDEGVDDVEEFPHHRNAGQQKCRHQQVVEDVNAKKMQMFHAWKWQVSFVCLDYVDLVIKDILEVIHSKMSVAYRNPHKK